MNLVDQFFPQRNEKSPEVRLMDDKLLVMHFWDLNPWELDELYIPQFLIMRNYAVEQINEERSQMNKMFGSGKRGGVL